MFKKILSLARQHKIITGIIIIAVIGLGYYGYNKLKSGTTETQYVLAAATKETIISAVSGSGQVAASGQVDLKPKQSGAVIFVGAQNGQLLKAGQLIVQLDARDAQKTVRDAEVSLASAKISLNKLLQPVDSLSLMQSENSLTAATQAKEKATADLQKAYDDAFTAVSNAFLDLPGVMTGMQDIMYKNSYSGNQDNLSYYTNQIKDYDYKVFAYKTNLETVYQTARAKYDQNLLDFKSTSRYSDNATIMNLLDETYDTVKAIAEAVKSGDNFLSFVKDKSVERNSAAALPSYLSAHQTSIATYIGTTNDNLASLSASKNTIKNAVDTIKNSDLAIKEKTESLKKLQAGTDELDLQSARLSVEQRANALVDAREKLADYFIRAPFDGEVTKMSVKKSDSASAGAAVATFITKQQLATISLNEVDVAKVKAGQKVTMTFDAIDGLTISGKVAEVDAIGAASQGVVSYGVKLSFDMQDDRVKPGMSVNASIITDVRQDVLTVPNSAIKTQNNTSYVEMLDETTATQVTGTQNVTSAAAPRRQTVQTGISDDNVTEITSGLQEGDKVITKTVTITAKSASQSAPSLMQSLGGNRSTGGGGAARIPRGN